MVLRPKKEEKKEEIYIYIYYINIHTSSCGQVRTKILKNDAIYLWYLWTVKFMDLEI